MALDPETIKTERAKIQEINVSGIIGESTLIDHTECIDHYESSIDTEVNQIDFSYSVHSGMCSTDSINDIVLQPFAEGANAKLSLTEAEPHAMVSGTVLYTEAPDPEPSLNTTYLLGGAIILAIGMIIGLALSHLKKNKIT